MFRIKELEDAGLTKIPKHLQDYYKSRRLAQVLGFTIMKPISIAQLVEACYKQYLGQTCFMGVGLTCYGIECEEFEQNYSFRLFIC